MFYTHAHTYIYYGLNFVDILGFYFQCLSFHGLLCEEEGNGADNVQYCGYCKYHFSKLVRICLEFNLLIIIIRFELSLYKASLFWGLLLLLD